jgi:hypothetical protein
LSFQTIDPFFNLPTQYQEEVTILQENWTEEAFNNALGIWRKGYSISSRESSHETLPLITDFFRRTAQLQMSNEVPQWLDSVTEQMLPTLRQFTSPKKIYEVERMAAAVRILLGEIPITFLAPTQHAACFCCG